MQEDLQSFLDYITNEFETKPTSQCLDIGEGSPDLSVKDALMMTKITILNKHLKTEKMAS